MNIRHPLPRSLAALAFSAALALPALAVAEPAAPLKTLELAAELYQRGLDSNDPILLMAAARLRRDFNLTAAEGTPEGASGPVSFEEMIAAAREAAADNPEMLDLVDDLEAEGARGVTTGQVYSISEIATGGLDVYDPLTFAAGEYAEVYVESNDGADLNVYVYDSEGRLVCSDTDESSISYCGWRPAEDGAFTIKVENRGGANTGYALMTN